MPQPGTNRAAAPPRIHRWILAGIVLVALASRLIPFAVLYPADPERIMLPDSRTYERPARALLERGVYTATPEPGASPELKRTPGYPLMIAAAYLIAGERPWSAIVLQNLICAGGIALVWLLARRFWDNPWAAHLAAALMTLDPVGWLFAQLMLSDALFSVMLLVFCWVFLRLGGAQRRAFAWAAGAGLALAAATFVRPISIYLIWPVALGAVWMLRRRGWGQACALAGVLLVAFQLPVLGWTWRNARATGQAQFCTIQNYSLYLYRAAGILMLRDGITLGEAQRRLAAQADAAVPQHNAEWEAYARREALRLLRAYPRLTLISMGSGIHKMYDGGGGADIAAYDGYESLLISRGAKAFSRLLYAMGILGIGLALWRLPGRRVVLTFYCGVIVYLTLVSAGPEAYFRFRLPVDAILAIFAAGLAAGWRRTDPAPGPPAGSVSPGEEHAP